MLSSPTFLAILVLNSVALGMNLFIIAVGLSLVFGVLRVINFAHGAFFMVGAYGVLTVVEHWGGSFWLGVAFAAVLLAVTSYIIERSLLSRLYDKEHLLQLLFTFAVVLIISDVAKMVWGTDQHSVSAPEILAGAVDLGIVHYPRYLLFLCLLGPVLALAMWLALDRTRWGRLIRAATLDREMLSALGINVPAIYSAVFVTGSVLAGIGGALATPRIAVAPGMDTTIIIECFIIVIIGGLGSLWGSFLGALILGFVTMFGTVLVPEWDIVMIYVIMLVVLLWRPWGLFGKSTEGGR